VAEIEGALGELSPFHAEFGFYVHGLPISEDQKQRIETWIRVTFEDLDELKDGPEP
jgi:hypothetical protein